MKKEEGEKKSKGMETICVWNAMIWYGLLWFWVWVAMILYGFRP